MEQNSNLNGKAIASFIVSCVALLSGCCVWYIAVVCGVVAIVLGILALREASHRQQDLAIAGIVVGATGLAVGIVAAVLYIMLFSASGDGSYTPKDTSDTVLMAVRGLAGFFR